MNYITSFSHYQWAEVLKEDWKGDTLLVLYDWMQETSCDVEIISSLKEFIDNKKSPYAFCGGMSYDWWTEDDEDNNMLPTCLILNKIFLRLDVSNKHQFLTGNGSFMNTVGYRYQHDRFYESKTEEEAFKELIHAHARAVGIPVPGRTISEELSQEP